MSSFGQLLERLRRRRPPPVGPAATVAVPAAGDDVAVLFVPLDAIEAREHGMLMRRFRLWAAVAVSAVVR